jgi:hypothetical protein
VDSPGSGVGLLVGSCEYDDEALGSGTTVCQSVLLYVFTQKMLSAYEQKFIIINLCHHVQVFEW